MLKIFFIASLLSGCVTFYQVFDIDDLDPHSNKRIPQRGFDEVSGTAFAKSLVGKAGQTREEMILSAIKDGNFPNSLRNLQKISLRKGKLRATIYVMPDYLSVGSDKDFFRVPMYPHTAQEIASDFGFILPTAKIVDTIYRQSKIKLKPAPLPPGRQMSTSGYYLKHDKKVEAQRKGKRGLISGHKKDIVITNRLLSKPGRVAIYGWHRKNGRAIQPLSLVHTKDYVDYSHGVRLVRNVVEINGVAMRLSDAMADPKYAKLFNYEGVSKAIRYN